MFERLGLPSDNAPDDTETYAFQSYGQHIGIFNFLNIRQIMIIGALLIALLLLGLGTWFLLPNAEPEYRVVPNQNAYPIATTNDPLSRLPDNVSQLTTQRISITVPARIDQYIAPNMNYLYAFEVHTDLSLRIRVIGSGSLTPSVSVYSPNGELIHSTVGQVESEFIVNVPLSGVYAIFIEDILGTGGNYTLHILPVF